MTLEEKRQEVASLEGSIKREEDRIKSIIGSGAAAKRKSVERDLPDKRTALKNKKVELDAMEKDVKKNGPPKEVIPKGWVKVSQKDVEEYQKQGKLKGYDPAQKLALLK